MSKSPAFCNHRRTLVGSSLSAIASSLIIFSLAGCGTSGNPPSPAPGPTGTTAVTVLASSTANDQISQFNLSITGLTLTTQSGNTVSLITAPQSVEFIHLNGHAEPLITVNVPQGVYTSATATVGAAQFTCVTLDSSGSLDIDTSAYGSTPQSQVAANITMPITVSGTAMGISLDLQASPSATFGSCASTTTPNGYSIKPTFNLSAVSFAAQSSGASIEELMGLDGIAASVNAGGDSFSVTSADGPVWQVDTDADTAFQGISNLAALTPGMPVNMDVAVQSDGSLLAARVQVPDSNPTNLTIAGGPVLFIASSVPVLDIVAPQQQGYLYQPGTFFGSQPFSFGNATFQISSQVTNLSTLPFSASFGAADMVAGQNVSVTSHATAFAGGPTYAPAGTVTLIPQTIDGQIVSTSSDGGFNTYTVKLYADDLFPDLAVQPGQTVQLQNPSTVVVYADSNTLGADQLAPGAGTTGRFYGVVFNDNGTLRMDCLQIDSGVSE